MATSILRAAAPHWRHLPLVVRQAIVYATVGGVSALADVILYAALTRLVGLPLIPANVVSFLGIGTANFLANRRITFGYRGRPRPREYLTFLTVGAVGTTINTSALALFSLFMHDVLAKAFADVVSFFWNFGVNRTWTFRKGAVRA